jgi:hypothetical protein
VPAGTRGAIVYVYRGGGFEVEAVDTAGSTIAVITAAEEDIRPVT